MAPAYVNVSFQSCETLKRLRESPWEESLSLMNTHSNNCMCHINQIKVLKCFDQAGHLWIGHVFCVSDTEKSV